MSETSALRSSPGAGRASLAAARAWAGLGRVLDRLAAWQERAAARRRLDQLDDWMLKDVGLNRADVARETAKPFWRA